MTARKIVIFGWAESEHIRRWAPGLKARGHDLLVISLGGTPLDNVRTHVITASNRLTPILAAHEAARVAREFDPDLAHVHYASTFGFLGLRSGVRPLVVSVWGSDIVSFPSTWIKRRYIEKVLSGADSITATSKFLEREVKRLKPDTAERIKVIPFGVDVPDEVTEPPGSPVRLCYIKRHKPVCGPDVLLRALAKVVCEIPEIKLTMAGSGPMTDELKELAIRLDITEYVEFPGMLPRPEVDRLLADSHIMVMPSLEEAFGVAALEASACGRPVIASNVGGVSEVVCDGETGLLVAPRDEPALASAIILLAKDRQKCRQMGKAGYDFVKKHYLWRRSLDQMEALYERLIDEKT